MAITVEARSDILSIVVGMFNGAPGATILSQLTNAFEAGQTRLQIATNLASTAEYLSIYPAFQTNGEFVTKLVDNMLGSLVTAENKAIAVSLLTAKLNAANTSTPAAKAAARADVSVYALDLLKAVPTTDAGFGAARVALDNKVEVATFYSVEKALNPASVVKAQEVIQNVTNTAASVTTAKNSISGTADAGQTFTLTVGVDNIPGTTGNDTINALTVNATTGEEATTIGAFDVVDGGAGTDTLNIYADTDLNEVQRGTFKNIEIVNIFNATAGDEYKNAVGDLDASKFDGATQVWQNGTAVDVVSLAATTTAGFATAQAGDLSVAAAATAASATVALDEVADADTSDGNDITLNFSGDALNTVTVTGTLAAGTDVDESQSLDIDVTVGEDETTLTVNTAIDATLTFDDSGSTDEVDTINAAGSAGGITFAGDNDVVSLTTGAGNDDVVLSTAAADDGVEASVTTGEGDDVISVTVDGDGNADVTTTVSAGAGDDEIDINTADTALNVDAGAGDDTITLTLGLANVATTDVIGGGDGTDKVIVAGAALVAEDYILLTEVVTDFEAIEFTGATAADIDASRMSNYKDITFAAIAANVADAVADDQALTLKADDAGAALAATADGYDDSGADTVYEGTLDVTVVATDAGDADVAALDAFASALNLTVSAAVADVTATLTGDLETAIVTLTNKVNTAGTDMFEASLTVSTDAELEAMTSLKLVGDGNATVDNDEGSALVSIDASELNSTTWDAVTDTAVAGTGLVYFSDNTKAETIKLGDGIDEVVLTASTVLKMDTVTGLNLVAQEADATLVDTDLSDTIGLADGGATYVSVGEIEANSLNLALVNVAALADKDNTIFEFAGNTYIFTTADDVVDDTDGLIKITGTVDHDLLINSLSLDLIA